MAKDERSEMFDWKLYGLLIRKKRMDIGYKKAEDFSDGIWRRTRVKISRDTLYKIEQGRQIPDASQFMALNLAVDQSLFNPEATNLCTSQEWKSLVSGAAVPCEWKRENAEVAWKNSSGMEDVDDFDRLPRGEDAVDYLSKQAHILASDAPELFDTKVDDEWHEVFETYLTETYGLDQASWPDLSE